MSWVFLLVWYDAFREDMILLGRYETRYECHMAMNDHADKDGFLDCIPVKM